jgi:TIR domain
MAPDELAKCVAELRKDSSVRALYEQSPGLRAQLDRCCRLLCEQYPRENTRRLAMGVTKAHRAMKEQYRVFISYRRVEHATAATKLHRVLEGLGAGRINAFLDTSTIPYGAEWLDQLRRDSGDCHTMIVLVPHNEGSSGWMAYENSIFEAMMVPGDRLVVVYHPQGTVPERLSRFHALPAESSRLGDLLNQLLIKEDAAPGLPPINPRCGDLINEQAIQISQRFVEPDLIERPTLNFMRLRLPQPGPVTELDTLLNARVTESEGLDIMFKRQNPTADSLAKVLERTGGMDTHRHWLEEFCSVVKRTSIGDVADPTFTTFTTEDRTRTYRPALRAIFEDEQSQAYGLDIVFTENLGARLGDPPQLEVLRTALRLTTRTRWEILQRYLPLKSANDIEQIERLLRRVERDAEVNGLRDRDLLAAQFAEPERTRVLEMFDEYGKYRDPEHGGGHLDTAFKQRDRAKVENCLKEIKKLNREFMLLGIKRFTELVEELW